MNNPMKDLSKLDRIIWMVSLAILTASNLLSENIDVLTLIAAYIGVTSLIFAAKGKVFGQILMSIFSILYAVISCKFQYWGEMITYLGMTLPMALWSTVTWVKNPAKSGKEVAIRKLSLKHILLLAFLSVFVTAIFCYWLCIFNTPHIVFSTLSITTSFLAASLTMLRSSYYALWYALNDMVLIILWTFASMENPAYISVVINFIIFLINDMYGFINWEKREAEQDVV